MNFISGQMVLCTAIFALVYAIGFMVSFFSQAMGFVFGILAICAFLVVYRDIRILVLFLIVLNLGIIPPEARPGFLLAGGPVFLSDILLGIVLMASLVDGSFTGTRKVGPPNVMGVLIIAFYCLAAVSFLISLFLMKNEPGSVLGDLKDLLNYLVFFIILAYYQDEKRIRDLVSFICILALLVSLVSLVQYFTGLDLIDSKKSISMKIGSTVYQGISRQKTHGDDIAFFAVFYCLTLLFGSKIRINIGDAVISFLIIISGCLLLIVTFLRGIYISFFICLFLLVFLTPDKRKLILIGGGAIPLITGIFIFLMIYPGSSTFTGALFDRMASISKEQTYTTDYSMQWRVFETQKAIEALKSHPFTGAGFGGEYHDVDKFINAGRYIHNGYFFIALKMGLQGLCLFLIICMVYLYRTLRLIWRMRGQPDQIIATTAFLYFGGLMIASLVRPNFSNGKTVLFIGIIWGITECLGIVFAEKQAPFVSPAQGAPAPSTTD